MMMMMIYRDFLFDILPMILQ